MTQPLTKCVMYVDYEDFMVGLSHLQCLDVDKTLIDLLQKAQQRFEVQQAIVLADWTRLASRPFLEEQGFNCWTVYGTGTMVKQEIQFSIAKGIESWDSVDVYMIVSGESDYSDLFRQLREAGKKSLLWTVLPPSPNDQALCSEWELVKAPQTADTSAWPRQVMLHAIVLAATHLPNNEAPFLMSDLLSQLRNLDPFSGTAETWLNIAIREQLFLLERVNDPFAMPDGLLNRENPIVQNALFIRERILSVFDAMIVNRDWVAFGALEKALRTAEAMAVDKEFRHAWIELLVAQKVLIAEQIPQPDGTFQTTTLRLEPDHPVITARHQQQALHLRGLIVTVDNFMRRKNYNWMAVSTLLKILTRSTTRVEARATLNMADEQGVVQFDSVPSLENPEFLVTTLKLSQTHPLVQKTLAERDDIILRVDSLLTDRYQVSLTLLAEELTSSNTMTEDDAFFWIRFFVDEGILIEEEIVLGPEDDLSFLQLNLADSIVSQALELR